MNDFPEFDLDPIERLKIERQFQAMDLAAVDPDDGFLLWRTKINIALAREGLNAVWHDNHSYMTLQPVGDSAGMLPYLHVPKMHLEDLYEQEANPDGVACYFRAVMYDERFKLWIQEEEDEGPLV